MISETVSDKKVADLTFTERKLERPYAGEKKSGD